MRRFLITTASFYLAGAVFAQAPAPVVGVGTFIHVVADLDKTMRFYGDRLGLERTGAPGPRAFAPNAVMENLYDAKGSQWRVAVFKIPGSPLGLKFAEFKDVGQKQVHPRIQDPGASMVSLSVRDLDTVMAGLKEDATPVIGDGGSPRTALIKDPDGFYVQLVDGAPGAKLSLTVESLERTLGLRGASYRTSTAKVPGTDFEVEFIEFKGIDRQTVKPAIHDPGAGVLRLIVRSVDGMLPGLKAAGMIVVTAGGETVSIGPRHVSILRDPDNFFFQIFDQPNSAANLTPAAK